MVFPKVQLKRFDRAEISGTVKIVQKNLVNNGAANKKMYLSFLQHYKTKPESS